MFAGSKNRNNNK